MPRQRERERHRGVEVGAADVTDGVDPEHDHKAEGDRDADMAELVRLRVDHHGPATGEHERERPDRLPHQRAHEWRHPHQQQPALAVGWDAGSPLASAAGVLTALTIAPCIPSATSCVNSTLTSSKPASSNPATYSLFESAPAMQPICEPRSARCSWVRRSSATTSLTPRRPPGFSTRAISVSTAALAVERLITQFEITTSTESAGSGICSIIPFKKCAFVTPASAALRRARASISSVMSSP